MILSDKIKFESVKNEILFWVWFSGLRRAARYKHIQAILKWFLHFTLRKEHLNISVLLYAISQELTTELT